MNARNTNGFTMVELLTVIALIAVLATLLLTALVSVKKKSRQTVCTSNLRQICLALNMYLDDFEKRPDRLDLFVRTKYLPAEKTLLCPEDKTGNWGVLVESAYPFLAAFAAGQPDQLEPLPYSYLHPLAWDDSAWQTLLKLGPSAGIAACQLHGLGKPDPNRPTIYDYQGLLLRAQRDGAVVRRQIFWSGDTVPGPSGDSSAFSSGARSSESAVPPTGPSLYPWQFFSDEVPP